MYFIICLETLGGGLSPAGPLTPGCLRQFDVTTRWRFRILCCSLNRVNRDCSSQFGEITFFACSNCFFACRRRTVQNSHARFEMQSVIRRVVQKAHVVSLCSLVSWSSLRYINSVKIISLSFSRNFDSPYCPFSDRCDPVSACFGDCSSQDKNK